MEGAAHGTPEHIHHGSDRAPALLTAIAGIATDVTARRAAERALEASEARLREVFARGPVPQMVLQVDGTLAEVNPAFRVLFGYSEPELLGMRLQTLVDPADRALAASERHELASVTTLTARAAAPTPTGQVGAVLLLAA